MSLSEGQFGKMAKRAQRLRLDDQDCSFGLCRVASADFQRLHGGEIVEFEGPQDVSDAHEEWSAMADYEPEDLERSRHVVNKIDGNIVDWTASQFWRRGGLPLIEPMSEYKKRFKEGPYPSVGANPYKHGDYAQARREIRNDYRD